MKTLAISILATLLLIAGLSPADPRAATNPSTAPAIDADASVRFSAVHVFIDTRDKPLAAYQVEITATAGDVKLVGLEGGEHPTFKPAPYYDPAALFNNKVIVAAFSTANDLPKGKTRVATLMVQITGKTRPAYEGKLTAVAGADGKPVASTLTLLPLADDSNGATHE